MIVSMTDLVLAKELLRYGLLSYLEQYLQLYC